MVDFSLGRYWAIVSVLFKLSLLLFIIVHSSGCCKLHFIDNKTDLERSSVSFKDIQLVDDRARIKAQVFLNTEFMLLSTLLQTYSIGMF